jgi:hypothetical protein
VSVSEMLVDLDHLTKLQPEIILLNSVAYSLLQIHFEQLSAHVLGTKTSTPQMLSFLQSGNTVTFTQIHFTTV